MPRHLAMTPKGFVKKMNDFSDDLVDAFYEAAIVLKHHVEYDGWKWSSNFLREYVRCRWGYKFSNTISPLILDEVIRQHPELAGWIVTAERKD